MINKGNWFNPSFMCVSAEEYASAEGLKKTHTHVSWLWLGGSNPGILGNMEHPFITI